jgi:hypothetical protein
MHRLGSRMAARTKPRRSAFPGGHLQDEGFGVGPMTEQDGHQLGFQSSYGGDGRPSDQIMKACDEGFLTEVGPIWVSQRTPLTS